ncbi:unnamed protein product [Blepharisma stoltei]|uniref:PX domain-containing protein n=1 Tax=Blepharisma stoltei TaxID=1481888 RepID=A0AAU9JCM8_9CILI|nr:unnamed protein product [Blepharisma stoltei]
MESAIARISFTEKEQKYYSVEFDRLTAEQKKPLNERELMGHGAATFFRMLKIGDSDLAKIWELVSEGQPFLKFPNFMAAMRLCSSRKQGKPIMAENFMREQSVLARRQREKPSPNPNPPATNKSSSSSQNESSQGSKTQEESPQLNKEEVKSQEVKIPQEQLPNPVQPDIKPPAPAIESNIVDESIKQEEKPNLSEESKDPIQVVSLNFQQEAQPTISVNSNTQDSSRELSQEEIVSAKQDKIVESQENIENIKEATQSIDLSQDKLEDIKENIIPRQEESPIQSISDQKEIEEERKNEDQSVSQENLQPAAKDILDRDLIQSFPEPIISENRLVEEEKSYSKLEVEEIKESEEKPKIDERQAEVEIMESAVNLEEPIASYKIANPAQVGFNVEEEKIENDPNKKSEFEEAIDKIDKEIKQNNDSQIQNGQNNFLEEIKECMPISDSISKIEIPIEKIESKANFGPIEEKPIVEISLVEKNEIVALKIDERKIIDIFEEKSLEEPQKEIKPEILEKNIKKLEIQPFEEIDLEDPIKDKPKIRAEKVDNISNNSEEKLNGYQNQKQNDSLSSFKEADKNPSEESTPSQAIQISNSDLFNEEVFPRVQIDSINLNEDGKSENQEKNSEESSEIFQPRVSKPLSGENLLSYLEGQDQAFASSRDIIPPPPKPSESSFQEPFDNEIIVETPIHVSSGWFGSSSYYLYPIMTRFKGCVYNVKRRFSDLDWMHNLLVVKYKGFIIPPRPDKKYINNTDDKFIEERRIQMEKYLNIILRHPILCSSSPFRVFTQSSNEKFETDKAQAEASQDTMEYRNFEDMYDKVMAKVQNKFQVLFAQKILPFSKEISIIEDKIERMDAPVQALSEAFLIWTQRQKETSKSLAGISMPENPELARLMQRFSLVHQENLSELHSLSLEIHEEQLRLEGLKLAVSSYKSMIDEYSQQETLISRKLAKHRASADDDTASRYLSEIQLAQDTLDKLNETLSGIEKNIIQENTSFDEDRGKHILKTIISICSQQNSYYEEEKKFWRETANAPKGINT